MFFPFNSKTIYSLLGYLKNVFELISELRSYFLIIIAFGESTFVCVKGCRENKER